MTLDATSFLELCEKLRAMGAAQVEGYGFKAVFLPGAPLRVPAAPKAATGEPKLSARARAKAEAAQKATDEQLQEARRMRELGL